MHMIKNRTNSLNSLAQMADVITSAKNKLSVSFIYKIHPNI